MRLSRICVLVLVLAGILGAAGVAEAQRDFSGVEIQTTSLGDGLAMLQGAGGNLGVSTGPDGVLLIDDQYAPMTDKIRAAIAELSNDPVRFVLNTHWHRDHTGGNENLGRGGAVILAHDDVRNRMNSDQYFALRDIAIPASPRAALPIVTYSDGLTLHLNGQTIDVLHVDPAHTDGDSIVYFREADVLHLGDIFFAGRYPFIDLSSGGRVDGIIAAANRALEIAGPKTRIIPGHGPLSKTQDLAKYRDMIVTVRDRVRVLISEGKDLDSVVAAAPSADFDAEFGGGFIKSDIFVVTIFESLAADASKQ